MVAAFRLCLRCRSSRARNSWMQYDAEPTRSWHGVNPAILCAPGECCADDGQPVATAAGNANGCIGNRPGPNQREQHARANARARGACDGSGPAAGTDLPLGGRQYPDHYRVHGKLERLIL